GAQGVLSSTMRSCLPASPKSPSLRSPPRLEVRSVVMACPSPRRGVLRQHLSPGDDGEKTGETGGRWSYDRSTSTSQTELARRKLLPRNRLLCCDTNVSVALGQPQHVLADEVQDHLA